MMLLLLLLLLLLLCCYWEVRRIRYDTDRSSKSFENTETNSMYVCMYVCMYAVVVAAAAAIIVIELLLGDSSRRCGVVINRSNRSCRSFDRKRSKIPKRTVYIYMYV